MKHSDLPSDVAKLIFTSIDSIEQLRILLLLHSRPEQIWSTAEIVKELKSSEAAIQRRVELLYSRKVLARNPALGGKHQFTPASPEIRTTVDHLNEAFKVKPYAVMELIFSNRDISIQQLADAFRIKDED